MADFDPIAFLGKWEGYEVLWAHRYAKRKGHGCIQVKLAVREDYVGRCSVSGISAVSDLRGYF